MKIISLNTWAGIAGEKILDFFKVNQDVDIFCLQEVMDAATQWTNWQEAQRIHLLDEIKAALPDHVPYFRPAEKGEWGLAAFVAKGVPLEAEGEIFIHRWKDAMLEGDGTTIGKNLQWLDIAGKNLIVANIHGLWNGNGKTDTADRLAQSEKIVSFFQGMSKDLVLCGDFNLLPDTESITMIERQLGVRNLVKEFGVTSTRTSYYTKQVKFADYILVSPNVEVKTFKVMPDEVSDHAPLFLEI